MAKHTNYKNMTVRGTKLYYIWVNMRRKCNNHKHFDWEYYGARGITVCDEWQDDYYSFYMWAMDNGYKEGLTLDRVNNNGDYEPCNCRWVDRFVQAGNRRNNTLIEFGGEQIPLQEACRRAGLSERNSIGQLRRRTGCTDQQAFDFLYLRLLLGYETGSRALRFEDTL